MAERYIEEECIHFCSLYFNDDVKTVHNRLHRNEVPQSFHVPDLVEVYTYPTDPILRVGDRILSDDEHRLITYYVLINSPEVEKYLQYDFRLYLLLLKYSIFNLLIFDKCVVDSTSWWIDITQT